MKQILFLILLFFYGLSFSFSQEEKKRTHLSDHSLDGLTFILQAGMGKANNYSADFYNGQPDHNNNIYRILHSELYGYDIWNYLAKNNIIYPDQYPNPQSIEIAEYGKMHYDLALSIGFGIQYNLTPRTGFFIQFSREKFEARGSFLIKKSTLPSNDNYFRCGIFGTENRNSIDIGYIYRCPLTSITKFTIEGGLSLTNIKVVENQIKIGDIMPVSILNVWGSMGPVTGANSMTYYNNGVSFGFFLTPVYSFNLWQFYAADIGLSFRFLKPNLEGYEKLKMQNVLFIRFLINNFNFN